jgi:ABC-2 type transport system ATP-binding protein
VRRLINRVSVEAAFFKEMSAWENLSYAARLYGRSGPAVRDDALGVLHRLGLGGRALGRPMKQLSRGQQQKVAIARSVLTSPNLLLMDEPTTGLDPRSKREVQAFISELHRSGEVTVLLSTHDLHEVEALCRRIVVIDGGRIIADTSPDALRHGAEGGPARTLEEAFLHLTGRIFDDEGEEADLDLRADGAA